MDSALIVFLAVVLVMAIIAIVVRTKKPDASGAAAGPKLTTHPFGSYDETKIAGFSEYPGTYAWDIVGESNYQPALEEMCGGRTEEGHEKLVWALLVPETGNPHDENAVAVHMDSGVVGYLSRENAERFRFATANIGGGGCAFKVPAKIVGGWDRGHLDKGHFGVKLDLPGTPR